jgi:hypothetical protein
MRETAVTCLVVTLVAGTRASAAEFRVLAQSGSPPSATVAAEHFQWFDAPPVINNCGEVAFLAGPQADVDQPFPGATNVWLAGATEVHLMAASARASQQTYGDHPLFAAFFDLVLSDASTVAFEATLNSAQVGTSPQAGLWQASREGLQRIAQVSHTAPGFDERPFASFFRRPALAEDGSMAFFGVVGTPTGTGGPEGGLWVSSLGQTSLVARSGATAMDQEPDVTFAAQTFGSPFADRSVVTSGGRTVFNGFLDGPSISPDNGMGIWTFDRSGGLQLVVRAGDVAMGDGRAFVSFPEPPAVNDRGDVTFLAFVRNGAEQGLAATAQAGDFDVSVGIWTKRDGILSPRLLVGDDPPGVEQQATFTDFDRPLSNGDGDLAILAAIDGPGINEEDAIGIWSNGLDPDDELRLVARGGMPAPGAPQDVVFHTFLEPALNNAGQVAFMAGLAGPHVSDAEGNVLGLWGQDRAGRLRLVARTGDLMEVAPGDVRQIGAIVFASGSGGQDGWPRGLNDHGQVAFRARFTDGTSAVLLSSALTVPEPSAHVLVVVAITALLPLIARVLRSCISITRKHVAAAAHFATWTAIASTSLAQEPDYLYPDLIPFVREDQPYLQNWVIDGDLLRLETVFANVGDGLFQIRVDRSTASGNSIDVFQRVFIGTDNGSEFEDFPANRSVFHPAHGHLHLEDFSEFQLRSVTVGSDGLLGVGDLVTNTVKTSFLIHDGLPLPDPQWADAPSYPSFNFGTYQNISVGYGDVYSHSTVGQSIDIAQVEPGPLYWLRQIVDPTNVLRETDETNNAFEILIDLNEPSAARMHADGHFVRPGDFYPIVTGDLDFDQLVTLADWSLFREGAGMVLGGLPDAQKYILGDLNLDGHHSPADFLIFRQAYEDFNGAGSAADLGVGIPEPAALPIALAALLAALVVCAVRRPRDYSRPPPASRRWST